MTINNKNKNVLDGYVKYSDACINDGRKKSVHLKSSIALNSSKCVPILYRYELDALKIILII